MINQQTLELFIYVDGINDVPFFAAHYEEFITANGERFITSTGEVFNVRALNEDIVIHAFTYNAQRMGAAPTITTTIKYNRCLDELFSEKVYAKFNDEKYFLLATPTSSYSSDEIMYKHDATFVSERIALENTYFYDVATPNTNIDKPISNNSNFVIYGDINLFAGKLNDSLERSGLDYRVIIDDGIGSEEKLITVENKFFSEVLQEVYDTFSLPYYFTGKEIHIGYSANAIDRVFKYGDSDALVSISKTNANQRTINRVTGIGSEDNIPPYYPNISSQGDIRAIAHESNIGVQNADIKVVDYDKFAKQIRIDDVIIYNDEYANGDNYKDIDAFYSINRTKYPDLSDRTVSLYTGKNWGYSTHWIELEMSNLDFYWEENSEPWENFWKSLPNSIKWKGLGNRFPAGIRPELELVSAVWTDGVERTTEPVFKIKSFEVYKHDITLDMMRDNRDVYWWSVQDTVISELPFDAKNNAYIFPDFSEVEDFTPVEMSGGTMWRSAGGKTAFRVKWNFELSSNACYTFRVSCNVANYYKPHWECNNKGVNLSELGIELSQNPVHGDRIIKILGENGYIQPQKSLMPPIYRETLGDERYYNAVNGVYFIPDENGQDSGLKYEFENEYNGHNPKEQIAQFDEIKPSIKEMRNDNGLRIDMFSEFAYDDDDNDETYETSDGTIKRQHPIFFGKLRKLDFNLFDHAIDSGEMTFAMTSGHCGGCEFKIAVDANDGKTNLVQVYERDEYDSNGVFHAKGSLKRDVNGNIVCGREDFQPSVHGQEMQNDTINNEVWIALYKDNSTYNELMPQENMRPLSCSSASANDGDTFVILNISLPQRYILAAEEKLRQQLIQYMYDNNDEKFTFSVKFSRIFFAENVGILNVLDENSRITIEYNDNQYTLYIASLTYKVSENEILPEITVELKDSLSVSKNALQKATSQIKADLHATLNDMDVIAQGSRAFLRKDQPDTATQTITFKEITKLNGGAELDKYLESNDYFEGTKGLSIRKDDNNNWHIEADYLHARKKLSAKEVEIQKAYHIGGAQIKSAAAIVCSRVDVLDEGYKCYFQVQDDEGRIVNNEFVVGDQAYVKTFNLITDENGMTTNHYYWRLVTEVGTNYIILSNVDCDNGSTPPMIGDHIVQLGHRTDASRQVAVIDAGAGDGAPYYRQFIGIDSFSLPEPETQIKPGDNILTGKVDIKDGSLLTGTIVVKDDHDSPTVMVNGSNTLSNNGRKIVIAAGVNDYGQNSNGEFTHVDAKMNIYDDGTINVGGKVGLSATEEANEEKVRIWAGEIEDNKQIAPFRVLHDGTMIAQKAVVEGEVNAKSGTFENGVFNNVTVNGSVNSPFVPYFGAYIVFEDEKWWREPNSDFSDANFNMAIFDKVYAWKNEVGTIIFTTSKTPNNGDDIYTTYKAPLLTYKGTLDYFNNSFIGKDGIGKNDNLIVPTASYKRIFNHEELSWDSSNNGRVVRFLNASYGDVESTGYAKLVAPSGRYFYENGERFEEIIFSNQLVELIGWGEDDVFYGWIVLSRKDVQTKNSYGENKILYQGEIEQNVLTKFWSLQLSRTGEGLGYLHRPSDGEVTILVSKIGSETISDYRGLEDVENWAVIASGATVVRKGTIIYEEKDNDGNVIASYNAITFNLDYTNTHYVTFQVISTADWVKV